MLSFEKLVDLGFVAPRVYVMHQNISEWLTVDYLIAYKVSPTAYHTCFHHKSTTLVYVLEHIVIHSLYAHISSVNALLFPDVCFVFSDIQCVSYCCVCYCTSLTNICVCHLLF